MEEKERRDGMSKVKKKKKLLKLTSKEESGIVLLLGNRPKQMHIYSRHPFNMD